MTLLRKSATPDDSECVQVHCPSQVLDTLSSKRVTESVDCDQIRVAHRPVIQKALERVSPHAFSPEIARSFSSVSSQARHASRIPCCPTFYRPSGVATAAKFCFHFVGTWLPLLDFASAQSQTTCFTMQVTSRNPYNPLMEHQMLK